MTAILTACRRPLPDPGRPQSCRVAIAILAMGLASCASTPRLNDPAMCEQLDAWASAVAANSVSTVRLSRGGTWMVDHYKTCEHSDDDAARRFCSWAMEYASTEFMEVNINRALSCLQGQRIAGPVGNTGVESWSGKTSFYSPQLAADNLSVDMEYFMDNSKDDRVDFLQITLRVK